MSTRTSPFHAGVYNGIQTEHVSVDDRLQAVKHFNRAQCEAALKVQGLQKTVETAVRRRLHQYAQVATTITFEDHGQDFLEWDLDVQGKVIECRPFQAGVWCGRTVINAKYRDEMRKGGKVVLDNGNNIRYPLVKVQRFKGAQP